MSQSLKEIQQQLEELYSKNQLLPTIKAFFKEHPTLPFINYFKEINLSEDFGLNLLAQIALHKRANVPTMVGLLQKYANSAQECADTLHKCVENHLIKWDPKTEVFIVMHDISPELQARLDKFRFPLPMVIQPKKLTCNTDTGYLIGKSSLILKDNHHDGDICLDHLNTMNSIRLVIDMDTAKMVKNKWKGVEVPKETDTEYVYRKRVKAYKKYQSTTFEILEALDKINPYFYLTHKIDKRGRTYCVGYHVNYQGTSWNKAIVKFYKKEIVE